MSPAQDGTRPHVRSTSVGQYWARPGLLRTVGSPGEQNRPGGAPSVAERSSFVVVANRLPVDEVTTSDGERQWRTSPGGLVTALHPVLIEHGGTWIGWAGGTGEAPDPFELEG